MKHMVSLVALVASLVVISGVAACFVSYSEGSVSANASVGEGLTFTIDGKQIADGKEIYIKSGEKSLKYTVSSDIKKDVLVLAAWTSGDNRLYTSDIVGASELGKEKSIETIEGYTKVDFKVHYCQVPEEDYTTDYAFHFDSSKVHVTCGGKDVHDGDVVKIVYDLDFTVNTNEEKAAFLAIDGSWSDAYDNSGNFGGHTLGCSISGTLQWAGWYSEASGDLYVIYQDD